MRGGNRVRQVDRIMAADTSERHKNLVMMWIIGDASKGQPGRHLLVPKVAPYNLDACIKAMVLLCHVILKGFPLRLWNVLGHRVSPRRLAPGELVMCLPARGSSSVALAL
jgi:hypothetical protein